MRDERADMKIVGRKGRAQGGLLRVNAMQRLASELRKGRPFMPKGVFRATSEKK